MNRAMPRVLIMEDNIDLAFAWRDAFELNDFEVTICHTGEDACLHLDNDIYEIVVTDMFVEGGKGGIHIIGKIALMDANRPAIIAVTGSRVETLQSEKNYYLQQASYLGAAITMEKPVPATDLVLAAKKLIA